MEIKDILNMENGEAVDWLIENQDKFNLVRKNGAEICPRCESDMIRVDSNREMEMSEIRCIDCDLGFQAPVTEKCIERMWVCICKEDAADDGYEESI